MMPWAWLVMGHVHRNRGELPRSLACYRTAARLSAAVEHPYHAVGRRHLGASGFSASLPRGF
jgi:hypothetical protein